MTKCYCKIFESFYDHKNTKLKYTQKGKHWEGRTITQLNTYGLKVQ